MLAEILFHRETDSSGEASDHPYMARQRTVTLSQDDAASSQDAEAAAGQSGAQLQRQNTVTLSSKTDEEEAPSEKEVADDSIPDEEKLEAEAEAVASLISSERDEKSESEATKASEEEEDVSVKHDEEVRNLKILHIGNCIYYLYFCCL